MSKQRSTFTPRISPPGTIRCSGGGVAPVIQGERWRPIVDCPRWEVSDHGRVRDIGPAIVDCRRSWPKIISGAIDKDGYRRVRTPMGKRGVHFLVLAAFAGAPPEGHTASHLDGDPQNNNLSNLAWETHAANCARKAEHGTAMVGDSHPRTIYNEEVTRRVAEALANISGRPRKGQLRDIANTLGVSCHLVYGVRYHKRKVQ